MKRNGGKADHWVDCGGRDEQAHQRGEDDKRHHARLEQRGHSREPGLALGGLDGGVGWSGRSSGLPFISDVKPGLSPGIKAGRDKARPAASLGRSQFDHARRAHVARACETPAASPLIQASYSSCGTAKTVIGM